MKYQKFVLSGVLLSAFSISYAHELIVYTTLSEKSIMPIVERYKQVTGHQIKLFASKDADNQILDVEKNLPADVFIGVDAANINKMANQGIFKTLHSDVLHKNIPSYWRDDHNRWFGLSVRVRVPYYNTDKVQVNQIKSYADLADIKWKGKLCLRGTKGSYNQGLVAYLIATEGQTKAKKIVNGWITNLAQAPFENDTKMIEAIANGVCDVGIGNHYYLVRYIQKNPNTPVAISYFDQNNDIQVNISAAGVLKKSKQIKGAQQFIEWLSTPEAQVLFTASEQFPINPKAEVAQEVSRWGIPKFSQLSMNQIALHYKQAQMIIDEAQWK